MKVMQPEQMSEAFEAAFNSNDVEQLMKLYEPGAVLAPMPGQRAAGKAEIAAALGAMMEARPQIVCKNVSCMVSGDVALLQAEWTITVNTPGGVVTQSGRSAEVARRQGDGGWLYLIDHPYTRD